MGSMFRGMNGRPAAGGFTLIELLVTIAVIAIIATMGVPMYGQFTRGSALTSRTSDLVAIVHYNRSEAVSRQAPVRVAALGCDWNDGWQVTVVGTGDVLRIVDLRGNRLDTGITEAAALTQLDFDGQGRASAAITFSVCPDERPNPGRTLAVNRFGRVQLTQVDCP